jgi:hypothetical protein
MIVGSCKIAWVTWRIVAYTWKCAQRSRRPAAGDQPDHWRALSACSSIPWAGCPEADGSEPNPRVTNGRSMDDEFLQVQDKEGVKKVSAHSRQEELR